MKSARWTAVLGVGLLAGLMTVSGGRAWGQNSGSYDETSDTLPQLFHINPGRSSVVFSIPGHGEAANGQPRGIVKGSFQLERSTLSFVQDGGKISGQVAMTAASESSGNGTRDRAIRNQVLQAKQYKELVFVAQSFTGEVKRGGSSTIQVHGALMVQGKPLELTVPVTVETNGFETTARAQVAIPYAELGLPDLGVAGMAGASEIDLQVKLVGYLSPRN